MFTSKSALLFVFSSFFPFKMFPCSFPISWHINPLPVCSVHSGALHASFSCLHRSDFLIYSPLQAHSSCHLQWEGPPEVAELWLAEKGGGFYDIVMLCRCSAAAVLEKDRLAASSLSPSFSPSPLYFISLFFSLLSPHTQARIHTHVLRHTAAEGRGHTVKPWGRIRPLLFPSCFSSLLWKTTCLAPPSPFKDYRTQGASAVSDLPQRDGSTDHSHTPTSEGLAHFSSAFLVARQCWLSIRPRGRVPERVSMREYVHDRVLLSNWLSTRSKAGDCGFTPQLSFFLPLPLSILRILIARSFSSSWQRRTVSQDAVRQATLLGRSSMGKAPGGWDSTDWTALLQTGALTHSAASDGWGRREPQNQSQLPPRLCHRRYVHGPADTASYTGEHGSTTRTHIIWFCSPFLGSECNLRSQQLYGIVLNFSWLMRNTLRVWSPAPITHLLLSYSMHY